jgi:hypothetical protein
MKYICIVILLFVVTSCTTKLYSEKDRFEIGRIENTVLDSLKSYLLQVSHRPVKDTIIIRFDFNRETCWNAFDEKPDSVIMKNVVYYQNYIQSLPASRPQASVYLFREPGNKLNKIKLLNKDIIEDNGFLKGLFFKANARCGSSVIIDPSGNYLIRKSDAHFDALQTSKEEFRGFFKR